MKDIYTQKFAENAAGVNLVIDINGRVLFANSHFKQIVAATNKSLEGIPLYNYMDSQDLEPTSNKFVSLDNGEDTTLTVGFLASTGEVELYRLHARRESDAIYISGHHAQLFKEKSVDDKHIGILRSFLEYAPVAIAMFDKEMRYITASQKWYQDFDLDTDVVGKSHYEVIPNQPAEWKTIHEWCLQGHVERREEDSYVDNNSKTQWIKWEVQPWYEQKGDVGGLIIFVEIITEKKRAEKELLKRNRELEKLKKATLNILEDIEEEKDNVEKEKEKLSLILRSIGDGVLVLDEDRRIVITNDVTTELSGYGREELIGEKYDDVLTFVDKNNQPYTRFIDQVYDFGEITSLANDTSLIRKDGEVIAVADSAAPIKVEGEVTGCIVIFRDATEERRIDQMKSDFVSIASHQLRTPLTAIRWYAELLESELQEGPADQLEIVREIVTSNERMIALVNDLLSVSRIERADQIKLDLTTINLHDMVKEIIKENSTLIHERNVKVSNKIKEDMQYVGDEEKLFEIVQNLLNNAIKYSKHNGKVDIDSYIESNHLNLVISDNGIGIPGAEQKKVFGKFFRAENATQQQTEGNGLGLYIVKSFTEAHGGRVRFNSKEGQGSEFKIILPIEKESS